ncbi:MAG: ATP-binding protein [Beutenbergiaceae bacterium]
MAFFEEPQPEVITLAAVGGLSEVKERLRLAFLEPMSNPEIAKAYGKSLRGGLLLYGPPGTGKTYLAKAVAGELGARFLTVTVADILDGVMGESEKNVRWVFDRARELAPCVLFIDELDSLGGKRSGYSNLGWMRNVVNQLLQEMDGVGTSNDGVFLLAATNHPWDVDSALLRPGRFDRMVLVTPPDPEARAVILKLALKDRPISGINLDQIAELTQGFTAADLTHLVLSASERAMSDSIASGSPRCGGECRCPDAVGRRLTLNLRTRTILTYR